jgi:hypothetical protein
MQHTVISALPILLVGGPSRRSAGRVKVPVRPYFRAGLRWCERRVRPGTRPAQLIAWQSTYGATRRPRKRPGQARVARSHGPGRTLASACQRRTTFMTADIAGREGLGQGAHHPGIVTARHSNPPRCGILPAMHQSDQSAAGQNPGKADPKALRIDRYWHPAPLQVVPGTQGG